MTQADLSSDLIFGARAIAKVLGTSRQRIYRLAKAKRLPVFFTGNALCARVSVLKLWIELQERQNSARARECCDTPIPSGEASPS